MPQSVPTPRANSGIGAPECCGLGCRLSALLSGFRICYSFFRISFRYGATLYEISTPLGGGGGAGTQTLPKKSSSPPEGLRESVSVCHKNYIHVLAYMWALDSNVKLRNPMRFAS